jgi:hypothetical protein
MYRRVPAPQSKPDRLSVYRRLTPRDRLLLSWLAEHYLLSTGQIHRALFSSLRTAQMRLTILHRLQVLHRFAFSSPHGVAETPYLYTLGPVGLRLHPDAYSDPDNAGLKAPRSSIERADRIARSRKLDHLLGVNQFFVDLHAHTRTHPDTRLLRWWSEQHTTTYHHRARIFPDGHGIWSADGHTVGFFLEHDRGTENLRRVVAKLRGYERLARFGPRFPVLLWVPNARREASLLDALNGAPLPMPVVVAVHGDDPAAPGGALTTDPFRRRALHQLPADPGPAGYPDPTVDDEDAGFDEDDPLDDEF